MAAVAENTEKAVSPQPGKKRRGAGKPFQKGVSGNPGGRPKKTVEEFQLIEACRSKTPEAMAVIEKIMRSGDNDRVRLQAALAIIERGHGTAPQRIEHTGAGGGPIQTETRTGPLEPDQAYRDLLKAGDESKSLH